MLSEAYQASARARAGTLTIKHMNKYHITLTKSFDVDASNEDEAREKATATLNEDTEALTLDQFTWSIEEAEAVA